MKIINIPIAAIIVSLTLTSVPIEQVSAQTRNRVLSSPTSLPKIARMPTFTTDKAMPAFDTTHESASGFVKKRPLIHRLAKKHFRSDEEVKISVENTQSEPFNVEVFDAENKKADMVVDQQKAIDQVVVDIAPRMQFRPGKYKVVVTDRDGTHAEQDFLWGVLALNTNRAIYKPGQTADISIGVLDDKGKMVCDAKVEVKIKHKQSGKEEILSTENKKITVNSVCHSYEFTTKPDYEAQYTLSEKGEYTLTLIAETPNGTYTIMDAVAVQDSTPFDIERTSATRIYPPNNYPVNLKITANQDFEGTITETVPESFVITPSEQNNSYDSAKTLYLEKKADPSASLSAELTARATQYASSSSAVLSATTSAARTLTSPLSTLSSPLLLPFAGAYSITQGFSSIQTENVLTKFYQNYGLSGHDGIDFGIPENTPIYAVDDANVILAGDGDYGVTVVLEHTWGKSYYGHLNKVTVGKDTYIQKGTQIGFSGNTGESTGPHLHFGMKPNNPDMNNGYYGKVDPLPYFNLPSTATFASNLDAKVSESGVLGASTSATQSFTLLDDQIRKDTVTEGTVPNNEKVKIISWHVSLKKGQTTTLSYQFKTPQVSPQFYLLGPLRFYSKDTTDTPVFEETRQWQIAADAITSREGPLLVDYNQSVWNTETSTSEVTGTINWNANDLIVVVGATEDNAFTLGTPTATGLSFSLITSTAGASNTRTYLWSATASSAGSGTVTSTVAGGTASRGLSVFVYRGSEGLGANNTITGSTAKTISLTRDRDNSAVVTVLADWNAVNDTSVTTSPAGGTVRVAQFMTSSATFFVEDWPDQGTAGTTSYGLANHTGTVDMSGIAVEIYGSTGNQWYNDGTTYGGYNWQYRKQITTTSSSSLIPSSQNNFPMLVNISADADLAAKAKSDGSDILFTDINGNKLDHEIEKYTTATGALVAWVDLPVLATSTTIYMYYGNQSASSQQVAAAVWDFNYTGIWHLNEVPNVTCFSTFEFCDATNYGADGDGTNMVAGDQQTGKIDGSISFNSTNLISVPTYTNSTAAFTLETWLNPSVLSSDEIFRTVLCTQSGCGNFYLQVVNREIECGTVGGGNSLRTSGWTPSTSTWYHVVCTFNNSTNTLRIYSNGSQIASTTGATGNPTSQTALWIGATSGGGSEPWEGSLDEVRVSITDRSADWITAEYNNQNSPSTFYTLSAEETKNYAADPSQMMRHGRFFDVNEVIQPFIF